MSLYHEAFIKTTDCFKLDTLPYKWIIFDKVDLNNSLFLGKEPKFDAVLTYLYIIQKKFNSVWF